LRVQIQAGGGQAEQQMAAVHGVRPPLQWAVDIMPRIPEPLHALLANLIDYAGLYPPAGLPLPEVLENYEAYLASAESWMLNRLVLPAAKLPEVRLRDNWRVTLLVEGEPGPLPAQVETLETRLPRGFRSRPIVRRPWGAIAGGRVCEGAHGRIDAGSDSVIGGAGRFPG
jgi:hypothetical protein